MSLGFGAVSKYGDRGSRHGYYDYELNLMFAGAIVMGLSILGFFISAKLWPGDPIENVVMESDKYDIKD
jgi:hypothetical protein